MTIAEKMKSFYVTIDKNNGFETFDDFKALIQEAEDRATLVTSSDEAEITEYDFADGSVMIVDSTTEQASTYGSR